MTCRQVLVGNAGAQASVDNPGAIDHHREATVSVDNFVGAATDLEIGMIVRLPAE